jgi:Papain fold toxin 1, glutamine deamidase
MAEWAGVEPKRMTTAEIGHRLAELGPGTSAVVGCDWKDGGGHWFNVVNDAGAVKAVDGQFGLIGRRGARHTSSSVTLAGSCASPRSSRRPA